MSSDSAAIVFMGSPPFAVPTLEALIGDRRFDVVHVATQPDRPSGRGKRLTSTPVNACARANGIPTVQMSKENYGDVVRDLAALRPEFIVVAAFGIILRNDLLQLPTHGCINLHASLLPRHRGVSPIQAAILSGDAETGCTTMRMDAGIDTGDMLLARAVAIADHDTAGSLERKLAALGAPLVVDTLHGLLDGSVRAIPQDEAKATYTRKIRKEHGEIDWSKDAVYIARQIRAMSPWPTAFTRLGERRVIVVEGRPVALRTERPPGEIVTEEPLTVAAGEGAIELVTVKIEGKKEMPARALSTGYRVRAGDRLG